MAIKTLKELVEKTVDSIRTANTGGELESERAVPDAWEAWKCELQDEPSALHEAFAATITQVCEHIIDKLPYEDLQAVLTDINNECPRYIWEGDGNERELLIDCLTEAINERALEEVIKYNKPDFDYYYSFGLDFVIYGEVIKRTGDCTILVKARSAATNNIPEEGEIYTDSIEGQLTQEQYDRCEQMGWPEEIEKFKTAILKDYIADKKEEISSELDEVMDIREKKGLDNIADTLQLNLETLKRLENELIDLELDLVSVMLEIEDARTKFCRALLPKYRVLDKMRAAYFSKRAKEESRDRHYRVIARVARDYVSRLLSENEYEFIKRTSFEPSEESRALYRSAMKGNLPALAKDEAERQSRAAFAEKVISAYRQENVTLLKKLVEEVRIIQSESTVQGIWAQLIEVNQKISIAERRIGDAEREMKRIIESSGYQLLDMIKEAQRRKRDFIFETNLQIEESIEALRRELSNHDIQELLKAERPIRADLKKARIRPLLNFRTWQPSIPPAAYEPESYSERCIRMAVGKHLSAGWKLSGLFFHSMAYGPFGNVARLLVMRPWLAFARGYLDGTPLIYASYRAQRAVVEALILFGADINAVTQDSCDDTAEGETALMQALKSGEPDLDSQWYKAQKKRREDKIHILEMLINKGADLNTKHEWHFSAIGVALEYQNYLAAKILLGSGADPQFKSRFSVYPIQILDSLIFAGIDEREVFLKSGFSFEALRILLSQGIDPDTTLNKTGCTLLHAIAKSCINRCETEEDINRVRLLLSKKADPEARYYSRRDYDLCLKKADGHCSLPEKSAEYRKDLMKREPNVYVTPFDLAIKGSEIYRLIEEAYKTKRSQPTLFDSY